jgi:hypothetical protein
MDCEKDILRKKLISQNRFWSVENPEEIPDDILIEKTLIFLDLNDINKLFSLYSRSKIKKVWRERVVIQDDYYHKLNKLLAWMYFDIKKPERYLKTTISRHINRYACLG